MSTDDPYRELREPVLAAASTLAPPTAAAATRRLHRRRARRAGVASVAVVLVVAGAVGLAGRAPERELQAGGVADGGSSGAAPGAATPGTVPGTVLGLPDGSDEPQPLDPVPSPGGDEPTTTTTAPPDGPSLAFAGTYEGLGHFAFGGDCPDLTHDLDLTMAVDDGSTWALHADYCATTGADGSWHGEGPFTIVTPDGSTLVGTLVGNAQLPTGGVPYDLIITGGTATYDGVEGNCSVTVTLDELGFGLQGNTGTFDCTVQI